MSDGPDDTSWKLECADVLNTAAEQRAVASWRPTPNAMQPQECMEACYQTPGCVFATVASRAGATVTDPSTVNDDLSAKPCFLWEKPIGDSTCPYRDGALAEGETSHTRFAALVRACQAPFGVYGGVPSAIYAKVPTCVLADREAVAAPGAPPCTHSGNAYAAAAQACDRMGAACAGFVVDASNQWGMAFTKGDLGEDGMRVVNGPPVAHAEQVSPHNYNRFFTYVKGQRGTGAADGGTWFTTVNGKTRELAKVESQCAGISGGAVVVMIVAACLLLAGLVIYIRSRAAQSKRRAHDLFADADVDGVLARIDA